MLLTFTMMMTFAQCYMKTVCKTNKHHLCIVTLSVSIFLTYGLKPCSMLQKNKNKIKATFTWKAVKHMDS